MSCFQNLIGLRDVCGEILIESTTGYYLNDLPGIDIGTMAAATNKEAQNARLLIDRVMALADQMTFDSARTALKSRWSINTLLQSRTTGLYSNDTPQAAQQFNVGQFFKSDNPYGELTIATIALRVNYTGTVPVKIWEANTGQLLKTIDFVTVAGEVTTQQVQFSKPPDGQRLRVFIGYDATSVPTYKTLISQTSCMSCKGGMQDFNYVQVYSRKVATGSQVIEKNLRAQNGMSGLSITWGLGCSVDPILCSMGPSMAPVLLFRIGELLAKNLQYSKRLSPEVLSFKADHKELATDYGMEADRLFSQALENAIIPKGECFKCTSQVKFRKTG